jgi:rhodanese-related sulfurtransferase
MRRLLRQAVVLVLASLALGAAVNAVRCDRDDAGRPRQLSWVTPPAVTLAPGDIIALADAERLWNEGHAFFLDARAPADYAAGRIARAHNLPVERFEEFYSEIAALLTPEAPLVVYCDGEQCELSHHLMERLRSLGYRDVRVLVNGWTVWRKAGLPTERGGAAR